MIKQKIHSVTVFSGACAIGLGVRMCVGEYREIPITGAVFAQLRCADRTPGPYGGLGAWPC